MPAQSLTQFLFEVAAGRPHMFNGPKPSPQCRPLIGADPALIDAAHNQAYHDLCDIVCILPIRIAEQIGIVGDEIEDLDEADWLDCIEHAIVMAHRVHALARAARQRANR